MSGIFGGCLLVDGPLGPQPLHGQTQDIVLERWHHPAVAASKEPVTCCSCCDSPAKAAMRGELPGGVSAPVLCSRCADTSPEHAALILAALRHGYPKEARGEQ